MTRTNVGILTALFITLSTGLAEARVAGVSQPVSLWSGDTASPATGVVVASPRGQDDRARGYLPLR